MKKIALFLVFFICSTVKAQETTTPQTALEFQQELNKEYANPEESPLTEQDLKSFKSLDFYPIDEKYILTAQFKRTENERVFKMKTSTSRLPEYRKYGEITFVLEGKTFQLNIYQNIELIKKKGFEDYLFLPFSDESCGKESYIGGRYLDLRIPTSNTIVVDFNKAYNPYCAYNHKYSCPKVPLENDLNIAILSGVKKFHD